MISACFTGAVAFLLLLAVALLCSYELCAVYVTTGSSASEKYSPSGFFFGVSAVALAINMLFICRMVFNGNKLITLPYICCCIHEYALMLPGCGSHVALKLKNAGNGLNVDEYVRRSYKFAYSDCIEVGPLASLPEPPEPSEICVRTFSRQVLLDLW